MAEVKETILVKDACILIDLMQLDIFEMFAQTDYVILTTDAVVREITNPEQSTLLNQVLESGQIIREKDGSLAEVLVLQRKYRGISYQDATALELSKRKGGMLISADGLLRKAGVKEQVTVHGTLWVILELVKLKVLDNVSAVAKVKLLMKINAWISNSLCLKTIKTLEENS